MCYVATSSFSHSNGPERNILTDDARAWNGHVSTEANWISFDLGERYTLSGVRLRGHLAGEMFRDSALQYSPDGRSWATLLNFKGSREGCKASQQQVSTTACKRLLSLGCVAHTGGAPTCRTARAPARAIASATCKSSRAGTRRARSTGG